MNRKTKRVILWLRKFVVTVIVVFFVNGIIYWSLDGTPWEKLSFGGLLSATIFVLIMRGLDAWDKWRN